MNNLVIILTIGNRKMRVILTKTRKRRVIRTKVDMNYSFGDIINVKCDYSLNKETSTEVMGEKGRRELSIWMAKTGQVRKDRHAD